MIQTAAASVAFLQNRGKFGIGFMIAQNPNCTMVDETVGKEPGGPSSNLAAS